MSVAHIVLYRNILCAINFVIAAVGFYFEGGFSEPTLVQLGGLFILLSPIAIWNRWLYEGLFESERSRLLISYKSFQVIGLLMVIAVFLSITVAYDWGMHRR